MSRDPSGSDSTPRRELLEVEDDEVRQKRIQSLLENTNLQSPSFPSGSRFQPPTFPTIPSKPHAIPPSELLARAEAFLPLLAASNADLERADPATLDIENPAGGDDAGRTYVEMNLALGVFEQRRRQRPGDGGGGGTSDSGSDSGSGSDSDSDSGSGSGSDSGSNSGSGSGSGSGSDSGSDSDSGRDDPRLADGTDSDSDSASGVASGSGSSSDAPGLGAEMGRDQHAAAAGGQPTSTPTPKLPLISEVLPETGVR
ncbi:hypothetical protein BU17DRAFT_94616 [Hysterangium stoloniferum]|nr:hypothetical protein BU17DRAFT_94616 [Hysterangium stoloniferum]